MKLRILLILVLALALAAFANAQDMIPSVTVSDQLSLDGTVTVDSVTAAEPGFMVIHADNGEGAPGPVIGFAPVAAGENTDVTVEIDATAATSTLFAMLHVDTGEAGVYEFGEVEGADGPVIVDGGPVTPPFAVELIRAYDQFVEEDSVTIAAVVPSVDGFIVVHADSGEGSPGPVVGFAPVTAGNNTDVTVALEGELTNLLFPMLHVDTGEAGVYEFGEVEGADGPVVVDEQVATFPITTMQPAMRVPDQMVTDTVTAESVLAEVPGWLVIHADSGEGSPGPVIGQAMVEAGTNIDVAVEVDPAGVTPTVFPMLHVDTGEAGVYEFGEVEGADGPVMVDGAVLVFPIDATGAMMDDMAMGDESMGDEGASMSEATVTIVNFAFDSAELTVAPGTTITWTNEDGAPHTVTADDGAFDSGNMNTGDTFSFTFEEPGTYPYFCAYHGGPGGSGMAATIIVEG